MWCTYWDNIGMVICFDEVSNVSHGRFRVFSETSLVPPQRTTTSFFVKLAVSLFSEFTSIPAPAPSSPVYLLLHPVH